MSKWALSFCLFFLSAAVAMAEGTKTADLGLVPVQNIGPIKLKLNGLVEVNGVAGDEVEGGLMNMMLFASLKDKQEKFGSDLLLNFAEFQNDRMGDWLMWANFWVKPTDSSKLRVGRFSAAGSYAVPFYGFVETVNYPVSDQLGVLKWGTQAEYSSEKWLFLADIGGLTWNDFDSNENWDGVEASVRIQRNFSKSWVAVFCQASKDLQIYGGDTKLQVTENLYLRSALYYMDNPYPLSNRASGYVFAAWQLHPKVELHGMVDWVNLGSRKILGFPISLSYRGEVVSGNDATIVREGSHERRVTVGTRIWFDRQKATSLSVDLVKPFPDHDKSIVDLFASFPKGDDSLRIEARFGLIF